MNVKAKIYLDFLPLCGTRVFISNSRHNKVRKMYAKRFLLLAVPIGSIFCISHR